MESSKRRWRFFAIRNWTNPGLGDNQEYIDWIDCSDGGCGGGPPPGEDKVDSLIITFICGGDNHIFTNNFKKSIKNISQGFLDSEEKKFGCFPENILKAVQQKQGLTNLKVCYQSKEYGANGTYNPNTKTFG